MGMVVVALTLLLIGACALGKSPSQRLFVNSESKALSPQVRVFDDAENGMVIYYTENWGVVIPYAAILENLLAVQAIQEAVKPK